MAKKQSQNKHDYKPRENVPKNGPPCPDIFSFKKHSMDYFTVNGVILRTGYADKKYWYTLCIKELLDNAVDFLWKHYQGYSDTNVTVYVTKNDSLLHIKIRNSNSQNIPVFQNVDLIFDTEMRYGSKQNEKIISRGMLRDAMKHANDKSPIDTQYFADTIIQAAKKISGSVQTFRTPGFIFTKEQQHDRIPDNKKPKTNPEDVFNARVQALPALVMADTVNEMLSAYSRWLIQRVASGWENDL